MRAPMGGATNERDVLVVPGGVRSVLQPIGADLANPRGPPRMVRPSVSPSLTHVQTPRNLGPNLDPEF